MSLPAPRIIVIAGPNGAGKSTCAPAIIGDVEYLNADEIAKEIGPAGSGNVHVMAGRMLLRRLDEIETQHIEIAVETTLASRSLAPRIHRLRAAGYEFHLHYIWQPSADICVARVAERVRRGGHHIPAEVIRRRYLGGLRNLFQIYLPIADLWGVYRNEQSGWLQRIAAGDADGGNVVYQQPLWERLQQEYGPE